MDVPKQVTKDKVEAIKRLFLNCTTCNASEISVDKLRAVCQSLAPHMTSDHIHSIIDAYPAAIAGKVHVAQWLDWVFAEAPNNQPSTPQGKNSATLRVVQVTDVYILDNFPHLRNLIIQKRAELEASQGVGSQTISVLSGDFLMPYLLSCVDKGRGMMQMLNATPIDYVTWGNHEADLHHLDVMDREKEYSGIWINTNMTSHESFLRPGTSQRDSVVLEVRSADKSNIRRIGLIGVLSDDAKLYRPGAFGNATIEDPWETMRRYKAKLEKDEGCDLVLPLCHLYESQDEKTAKELDFPIVLSGHDHHVVDRWVNETRIVKPGADAHQAVVLDITWDWAGDCTPTIKVEFVNVADWTPDPHLQTMACRCYSVLDNLHQTQLCAIPIEFKPLSSTGSRSKCTSCAKWLCTSIRNSLNIQSLDPQKMHATVPVCDCVLINGGNFRGEHDYADDEAFTLQSIMSEIDKQVNIWVLSIPGSVLRGALRETWKVPNGGWMQHCNAVKVDADNYVCSINGSELKPNHKYRVGTTEFFGVLESPSIFAYLQENPHEKPDPETAAPAHAVLMSYFAELAWWCIWRRLDHDKDGQISQKELRRLDRNNSGGLDKTEVFNALRSEIHFQTYSGEFALAEKILEVAGDHDGDGHLTLTEMNSWRRTRLTQLNSMSPPAGP